MLKFLPGILLLQLITVGLVFIAPADLSGWGWLRLLIPIVIAGVLSAFWFSAMAAHHRKDEIGRLRERHAKEREAIRVDAERAKAEVAHQAHKETLQEIRRTSSQANIKVGMAFAGLAGLGGLLLLTQFITLGIMTITTAGGALGGYLLRYRQENGGFLPRRNKQTDAPRMINAAPANKPLTPTK